MNKIICGDSLEVLKTLDENSIDSVVCDPPYELGFMGKKWDSTGIANNVQLWRECLRVLKPGGHLLAFSGSRTYHRMTCAIEDAGFEVRDQIFWLYGSGFPKSRNLDGAWQGWGTALKPAHEPICVARKPLIGTVAANVLAHGTGAINIDACRVGSELITTRAKRPESSFAGKAGDDASGGKKWSGCAASEHVGRWPANVIHDGSDEVLEAFPDAKGQQGAITGDEPSDKTSNTFGAFDRRTASEPRREADKSAARFFYCAKASKSDRGNGNNHPTVKPNDLMRYLCRLVTPPGGLILDPFAGSGSTGKAAIMEGFDFIGIELSEDYAEIARARMAVAT